MTDRYVSQREFARRVDRSHVWVNRLIKEGRLPANDKGKVPLEAGLKIFESAFQTTNPSTAIHNEKQRKAPAKKASAKKAPEKKSPSKKSPSKKASSPKAEAPVEVAPAAPQTSGDFGRVVNINEQYSRAKLARETFNAKITELKYKEAAGRLIPIEKVHSDAAKTGAEVRERLFGIAPRVAGLCEGKTAREIERIIDEEINDALSALKRSRFSDDKRLG